MSAAELVVPIELEALVVAKASKAPAWRRWRMDYAAMRTYASPQPRPGEGDESTEGPPDGIHLHWSLPEALRHGKQLADGSLEFPLVPNRWLVVRLGGADRRLATGWIVESDCPSETATAPYLLDPAVLKSWLEGSDGERAKAAQRIEDEAAAVDKAEAKVYEANLGASFISESWRERAGEIPGFLRAVAPGNHTFAAYQPHSATVFGFHDALEGVTEDTLSYMVVGWYSSAAEDPLATSSAADLGWSVPGEPPAPSRSVYHGIALDVPWEPAATEPLPSPLHSLENSVHVALGSNVAEAFTALVKSQLESTGRPSDAGQVRLLQAFQYGMLAELESPGGEEALRAAAHQAGFDSTPGGQRWIVVAAGDDEDEGSAVPEPPPWLAALNQTQAKLDDARRSLAGLRLGLYTVWWKLERGQALDETLEKPEHFSAKEHREARDRLLAEVTAAETRVNELLGEVPQPLQRQGQNAQQAFEAGIAAFAAGHGLPPGQRLKALSAPRYWQANDPALLLSGIEASPPPDPAATLACRLGSEAVSALELAGKSFGSAELGDALPKLGMPPDLPASAAGLLTELFLLDPRSAAAIATATGIEEAEVAKALKAHAATSFKGALPALGLDPWAEQPWKPLMMEWEIDYFHIPHGNGEPSHWTFDGYDYRYDGDYEKFEPGGAEPRRLRGTSLLTPEAQFNLGTRLSQFLDRYRSAEEPPSLAELDRLDRAVGEIDSWRFMSQRLTGTGELIAMRDSRPQAAPAPESGEDAALVAAVGDRTGTVPYLSDEETDVFEGAVMGQLAVHSLIVYDRFGQVLVVVGGTGSTSPTAFAPALDPAMVPDKPVQGAEEYRFAQLRPRLLQPARVDLDLVDAASGEPYSAGSEANPIGGWLLPNHLDESLGLYAPDGSPLGELALFAGGQGTRKAIWRPPPNSSLGEEELASRAPLLGPMVADPAIHEPVAFAALLDAIDSTLWTVDPLGDRPDQNLSVLIGRPLALVRVKVGLSLEGEPLADLSEWRPAWPPPRPAFTADRFEVRLGDQALRADGLIGYFTEAEYGTFNSVQPPGEGAEQDYVRQIGPLGKPEGGNFLPLSFDGPARDLTLLVDPRAAVHAVTGVLPAKDLTLPAELTRPLANLAVAFRTGPLLTSPRPSPGVPGGSPPHPEALTLPLPSERNGRWEWWEATPPGAAAAWAGFDLVQSSPDADLSGPPNSLREGFLQLRIDLEKGEHQ